MKVEDGFLYAYAIYEFARVTRDISAKIVDGGGPKFNFIVHNRHLHDHRSRTVTMPNNDTLSSTAILELSNSPVTIEVLSEPERYFSLAFMDYSTDHFAYIGTRSTKGKAGKYTLVGPDWSGRVPADSEIIQAPCNDVWLLARFLVDGEDDLERVWGLQDGLKIQPSELRAGVKDFKIDITNAEDPENFLHVVNEMMGRSSLIGNAQRVSSFEQIGLKPGNTDVWKSLDPDLKTAWQEVCASGAKRLAGRGIAPDRIVNGWIYPQDGLGRFGDNDEFRASIALTGLAALEPKEALYITGVFDGDGKVLSGENSYELILDPQDIPADAFWSVCVYEASPCGRYFMYENEINRYSIGDRTDGVEPEQDGHIRVRLAHKRPSSKAQNWLPIPTGKFLLSFRLYQPREAALNGSWRAPPVNKA